MANRRAKSKKELRELSVKELQVKLRDLEDHIFQLRMQWRTGQLASPAMMGLARKEMARAATYLRAKAAAVKPAKAAANK